MTISYNWLKQYLKTNLTVQQISDLLTDIGLEVEAIEDYNTIKGGLKNVVVGEVITCIQHPNADKLKVTTVNVGNSQLLNIVCGAPNVSLGQKVVVATVGAILYTSSNEKIEIKKSKIRSVDSEGMLCAEDELGLGTSHNGIIVLPNTSTIGLPLAEFYKNYSDTLIQIGLTPNRIDAASHIGVALDLYAAINARNLDNATIEMPSVLNLNEVKNNVQVTVSKENLSAFIFERYSGVSFENISIAESPEWLKNKLNAIGVKSINNVVDITNYVLHETGQPLHAFDISTTGNNFEVRFAKENEVLTTLDGVDRKLKTTDVVIGNKSNVHCLAGVMGGKTSGVNANTTSIFLEAACFNPVLVRKTSKHHNLKSDSSFRFERGTDPNATIYALSRAAYLLKEICNATASGKVIDIVSKDISPKSITVSFTTINTLIGQEIQKEEVKKILALLNFQIINESINDITIKVPTSKIDVLRPADIIEEILRIYGQNNITLPSKFMFSVSEQDQPDKRKLQNIISNFLSSNGYFETMNMSMSPSNNEQEEIALFNPLSSELAVLRKTMLHGMLSTVAYNLNRQQHDLKLFEFGKVYALNNNKFEESNQLCIALTGYKSKDTWQKNNSKVNLYTLKSIADSIFNYLNNKANIKLIQETDSLIYEFAGKQLAILSIVEPLKLKKYSISQSVYCAQINWDLFVLMQTQAKIKFEEIVKYPEVKRDLSLLVDKQINFIQLKEEAIKVDKNIIKEVYLFDVYEGDKLPENKKSYAISYILQNAEATMTDDQIESIMQKIIKNYQTKYNATLRA